jgi:hypothetical protein
VVELYVVPLKTINREPKGTCISKVAISGVGVGVDVGPDVGVGVGVSVGSGVGVGVSVGTGVSVGSGVGVGVSVGVGVGVSVGDGVGVAVAGVSNLPKHHNTALAIIRPTVVVLVNESHKFIPTLRDCPTS